MVTMPPIARTPWAENLASSANRANDAKISTTAANRTGKKIERENRQQNEHDAHRSRHHRAGMVELGIERQASDREKNERDVRDP